MSKLKNDYLSVQEIDGMTKINVKKMDSMRVEEKYDYLLPRAMVRMCYEIAARSHEICQLCEEDMGTPTKNGLVPISMIGGHGRAMGERDIVWIEHRRINKLYKLWKKVSRDYFKKIGVIHKPIDIKNRGEKGTPIFGIGNKNREFSVMTNLKYRVLFKKFMQANNMPTKLWHRTHILRSSRIKTWVSEGWDIFAVRRNARHKKIEITELFFEQ